MEDFLEQARCSRLCRSWGVKISKRLLSELSGGGASCQGGRACGSCENVPRRPPTTDAFVRE